MKRNKEYQLRLIKLAARKARAYAGVDMFGNETRRRFPRISSGVKNGEAHLPFNRDKAWEETNQAQEFYKFYSGQEKNYGYPPSFDGQIVAGIK